MNISLVNNITRRTDELIGVVNKGSKYQLSFGVNSRNPMKIEIVDDFTNQNLQRINKITSFRPGNYTFLFVAQKDGNLFMKIGGEENTNIYNIILEEKENEQ